MSVRTEIEIDPEISDLVPLFLNARCKDVEQLVLHSQKNEFDEMAKICHTIKGIARPYGFPSMEQLAIEMESECKNRNSERALALLNKMQEFIRTYSEC